jgi:hypothetical protein
MSINIVNNIEFINIVNKIEFINIFDRIESINILINSIINNDINYFYDYIDKQSLKLSKSLKMENNENINNISDLKSNSFFKELLNNQIKNVNVTKKLNYSDIKRLSKFITSSIFDKNNCSVWNGYITNESNQSKGTYINFYFNKKKTALHRLLFENFVGTILNNEYIKYTCINKGKCCNIHHMKKYSYTNNNGNLYNINNDCIGNNIVINIDKTKLTVEL